MIFAAQNAMFIFLSHSYNCDYSDLFSKKTWRCKNLAIKGVNSRKEGAGWKLPRRLGLLSSAWPPAPPGKLDNSFGLTEGIGELLRTEVLRAQDRGQLRSLWLWNSHTSLGIGSPTTPKGDENCRCLREEVHRGGRRQPKMTPEGWFAGGII